MCKEQYQHQILLESVSNAQMILFSNLYTYVPEETRVFFEPKIRNVAWIMAWIIPFSNLFILMLNNLSRFLQLLGIPRDQQCFN